MTAPHPTEATVRATVAPFEQRIAACLDRGLTQWQLRSDALGLAVSNRSRASLISDFIANEAAREFISDPNVLVRRTRGLPYLLINGRVAVRFRKFRSANFAISTGRTRQQELIGSHQLMLEGSNVAPLWLTAGYLLNETATDAQYAMTFAEYGTVQYVFDLSQPTFLLAPVVPIVEADDEDGLVIRSARQLDAASAGEASS